MIYIGVTLSLVILFGSLILFSVCFGPAATFEGPFAMACVRKPILLGDSIFKRLLTLEPGLYDPSSSHFCVSGSSAAELKSRCVAARDILKGQEVIVLIGANDVKRKTDYSQFIVIYKSLVKLLRALKCKISVCELLPMPFYGDLVSSCSLILQINKYIRSFEPSGIKVVHSFDVFCNIDGVIKKHLFCKYLGQSRRVDLIHPNKEGLSVLSLTLLL